MVELIETARLTLEPLRVEHAEEMAPLLDDQDLHTYVGGHPATLEQLRRRYARQAVGRSADGTERWLNWIARHRQTGAVVGTVQATLQDTAEGTSAEIAWVIARPHQRHGYANEAASAMVGWLREQGVHILGADIHPDHEASNGVARNLGLHPTDVIIDGEIRWTS